ncbi:aryl-alcohol dehydrogenase [Gracilibacillus halophilus YIM-C55.5]|uniref:Aryl-alcohol dehydrogenase n=1 Tax=Gracilibacillus halophilus YIM-C55.5 TaxID=1308866 RepID=N4WNN5_9BACI|nr:aryl-alcohol dehydrogenase [Gracilibacillus halophilus YIM-C55.5]
MPKLIRLYQAGKFPFDTFIKTYKFEDIQQAVKDTEEGRTIKPVLLM